MALLRSPCTLSYSLFLACLLTALCFPRKACSVDTIQCGTADSSNTFQSNLDSLFTSLSSESLASGYANDTKGSNTDQVYGLALCRGDLETSNCSTSINYAKQILKNNCSGDQSAVVWRDDCLLRYSNERFFSSVDDTNQATVYNPTELTGVDFNRFDSLFQELMDNISYWAAYNSTASTVILFGTGEVNVDATTTIYGLVQCTRDLSRDQCYQCLKAIIKSFPSCCTRRRGGRVLAPSCISRFELDHFYEGASKVMLSSSPAAPVGQVPPPPAATPPAPTAGSEKKKNKTGIALAIAIPATTAVIVLSVICICFCKRRSTKKLPYEDHQEEIVSIESLLFDLSTLKLATGNFSELKKLGEGGFGAVYKGLLPDGREIAVKRLSTNSRQGLGQLKNEVVLVAKLQHRNLARLLGVCLEEQEKLLVYEYVPNRSLDTFLFDQTKREELYWERRYRIIEGVARGLLYLHEDSQLKIIHRDLKASNILLDADMNPKISDFGMARLFGVDQTQSVTSRVVGTFGYMAPEYVMNGLYSMKSDVYSFGVLVLEIVTGRRRNAFDNSRQATDLISYIWMHWTNGTVSEIIEPSVGEHCQWSELLRCVHIGLLCVHEDPDRRPSMSSINVMLNSYSVTLEAPSQPTSYIGRDITDLQASSGTHERPARAAAPLISVNEVSISDLEAR